MEVKLKVLNGNHAGREIKLPANKFIIGRGEECHLRPKSDLISRQHCAIVSNDAKVVVIDGSKNGTFINEERIEGRREVHSGDKLRVGQMEFELIIITTLAAAKKPKVKDVKDAATRTAQSGAGAEVDVMSWLEDDNNAHDETRRVYMADTAQIMRAAAESAAEVAAAKKAAEEALAEANKKNAPAKKKEYGKLPPPPQAAAPLDSRQAAAETLKRINKSF
ncbi:MAG TPA: FHA domain-containing protein [Pirellulales bacterium]|jgi:pSer/pThr/pTyr-binding forkhead associated (FHA) protein|nr:FHA domain-containing protein [Pirellulales bacterium]